MIVFILGRTGSGKSTTARFLGEAARGSGWSVQSFNDYPFLRKMFETDREHRFRATEHDGFEVLDRSVFSMAIRSLAQQVQDYHSAGDQTLIMVEFTSNNYPDALQFFDSNLLRDAHIIFLNADLKTCLERTSKRKFHQATKDDYYVKDTVLLRHYPCPYMPLYFHSKRTHFINNVGSLEELKFSIQNAVSPLIEQSSQPHLLFV